MFLISIFSMDPHELYGPIHGMNELFYFKYVYLIVYQVLTLIINQIY